MENNSSNEEDIIRIQDMSIDQLAGAFVLILGAIGSLLLVIWQSRCACKCRIGCSDNCYIFDCSREPPPVNEDDDDNNNQDNNNQDNNNNNQDNNNNNDNNNNDNNDDNLDNQDPPNP